VCVCVCVCVCARTCVFACACSLNACVLVAPLPQPLPQRPLTRKHGLLLFVKVGAPARPIEVVLLDDKLDVLAPTLPE